MMMLNNGGRHFGATMLKRLMGRDNYSGLPTYMAVGPALLDIGLETAAISLYNIEEYQSKLVNLTRFRLLPEDFWQYVSLTNPDDRAFVSRVLADCYPALPAGGQTGVIDYGVDRL